MIARSSTHTFSPAQRVAVVAALRHVADQFGPGKGEVNLYTLADEIESRTSARVVERVKHEVSEENSLGSHRTDHAERHESFGLVGISRLSYGPGRNRMFGSRLDSHPTTYKITVRRAVRTHSDLAYDRFSSDHTAARTELIEFELTATQFVDMLTTSNVGEGVPCTIRAVLGEQMDPVPNEHKTETELIRERFGTEMRDIARAVKPITDKITGILDKRTAIGKKDRDNLASHVNQILRHFTDHAPWVMRQFGEATERMLVAGKAEVEAYAESVIRAAGLEALRMRAIEAAEAEAQVIEVTPTAIEAANDDA